MRSETTGFEGKDRPLRRMGDPPTSEPPPRKDASAPADAEPDARAAPTLLADVAATLPAALARSSLDDMAAVVLDALARAYRARRAALVLKRGDRLTVEVARPPGCRRRDQGIRWDIVRWAVERRTSVILTAGQGAGSAPFGIPCQVPESILCVPLDGRTEATAILYLTSTDPWPCLGDEGALLRVHLEILRFALERDGLRRDIRALERRLLHERERRAALGGEPPAETDTPSAPALPPEERRRLQRTFSEIVAQSAPMLRVLQLVERFAPTSFPVLIEGESGTGKELVAHAIHRTSPRAKGPFVSENCAACPDGLLESEFFGVERGAYSGADRARAGLLELAIGGTLFLDEIGEMNLALQKKLLRALQERSIRRLGGKEPTAVDFRLLSATNRRLHDRVAQGDFREDLLYRLNLVTIRIPPLRERREDIRALIEHFLAEFGRAERKRPPAVSPRALRILDRYDWPGNVRELRNEIYRAAVLGPRRIEPSSLSPRLRNGAARGSTLRDSVLNKGKTLVELERELMGSVVRDILSRCGGNKTLAARVLGIPKTTLYHRMVRYGIHGGCDPSPSNGRARRAPADAPAADRG